MKDDPLMEKTICRLCLKNGGKLHDIFKKSADFVIAHRIMECTNIQASLSFYCSLYNSFGFSALHCIALFSRHIVQIYLESVQYIESEILRIETLNIYIDCKYYCLLKLTLMVNDSNLLLLSS